MKIDIIYPHAGKGGFQRRKLLQILKWPFIACAIACPIVNYFTGGPLWSLVALMGLYMAWTLIFSPDLVEYNRISQFTKLATRSCILLILIDTFIAPGWAVSVVPIVGLGCLVICAVLFFTDLPRQKQNMLPMLIMIFLAMIASIVGSIVWKDESNWSMSVMGLVAFLLLITCVIILRKDFIRELKRRFHTK